MSEESLRESLVTYEAQLRQIEEALSIATDDQKDELEQVRKDLKEIIDLTTDSLIASNYKTEKEPATNVLEEELQKLEGLKCQVPFQYSWGGIGYHNAIVLSADTEEEGAVSVEVVFMHPTSKQMRPCPFFLEGECKYSAEKCHYSHGYSVPLDSIRDYEEPDYSTLGEGSAVLAKYKDDLWYRGKIEEQMEDSKFSVKFLHCDDSLVLDLHSVYPLDDDESDTDDSDDDNLFTPRVLECKGNELSEQVIEVSHTFGHWEKFTRGIGSKLMAKMGYVYGSGLGREGEGRTEPVKAVVFPPGRSLDWCMELREKAGNENILTVERKLERQKKKEEHRQRQKAIAAQNHSSVFDFINSKLVKKSDKSDAGPSASHSRQKMAHLKTFSGRKLNVESFQLGESIRRVEREVADLQRSLHRHSSRGDTITASQIQSRIKSKQHELERLRASEKSVSDEQTQRKSSTKLTIF